MSHNKSNDEMNLDKEFEKYLQGKSALSQLYADMPEVEAPGHLDAAILAEAHRAVNARPGAKPGRRWTLPLGLVASLFVAVMIGLQLPYMLKDAASPQQQKADRAAAMMDKSMAERSASMPEDQLKIQQTLQAKAKSENMRGTPAPAELQESIAAESKALRSRLVAPAAPVAAPSPAEAGPAAPMVSSGAAQSRTAGAFEKEKKTAGQVKDSVSDALEEREPVAAKMAAPLPAQLKPALKDEAAETNPNAKDWLVRIKRLKAEGKLDVAKKELAAFKKRYPDYIVPEALEIR
jgi:hypothetical protein